jgi:hypothetical protein
VQCRTCALFAHRIFLTKCWYRFEKEKQCRAELARFSRPAFFLRGSAPIKTKVPFPDIHDLGPETSSGRLRNTHPVIPNSVRDLFSACNHHAPSRAEFISAPIQCLQPCPDPPDLGPEPPHKERGAGKFRTTPPTNRVVPNLFRHLFNACNSHPPSHAELVSASIPCLPLCADPLNIGPETSSGRLGSTNHVMPNSLAPMSFNRGFGIYSKQSLQAVRRTPPKAGVTSSSGTSR